MVCLSDTHNHHPDPRAMPDADILVHAGGIYGPAGVRQNRQGWRSSRYSQGMRQELFEQYPTAKPVREAPSCSRSQLLTC